MRGYNLEMSGERVKTLLERQFIVPTLDSAPTNSTVLWEDGNSTTKFRVGEFCRVKNGNDWDFYRLYDISNNNASWVKIDVNADVDLSDYYTKTEVDNKISNLEFPEDQSVKTISQSEYDNLLESGNIISTTIYLVLKENSPEALYVGTVLIAKKEEGSKGFTYNFPIIF